jgi:hypothetical protein
MTQPLSTSAHVSFTPVLRLVGNGCFVPTQLALSSIDCTQAKLDHNVCQLHARDKLEACWCYSRTINCFSSRVLQEAAPHYQMQVTRKGPHKLRLWPKYKAWNPPCPRLRMPAAALSLAKQQCRDVWLSCPFDSGPVQPFVVR